MKKLMRFFKDDEGVTALEYGLIGALIACFIVLAVTAAGGAVSNMFNYIAAQIGGAIGGGA